MKCIEISTYLPSAPSHLTDEGVFYFDTFDDLDIKLSRFIETLTDEGKLKTDAVLGIELPSGHNDIALKKYIDPHGDIIEAKPIVVRVSVKNSDSLRFVNLYVTSYFDGVYKCELRTGSEHWAITASEIHLNEIDLNNGQAIIYDSDFMKDQNNLGKYEDGEIGIRFPLVNYGRFTDQSNGISVQDLRPLYSVLWVLQKGFCQIGWRFRSTIFESEFGRRAIAYLVNKDFGIDPTKIKSLRANVKLSDDISITSDNSFRIPFVEIIENTGGYWKGDYYDGAGIFDIKGTIIVSLEKLVITLTKKECRSTFRIMMETINGLIVTIDELEVKSEWQIYAHDKDNHYYHFDLKGIQIDNGSKLWIEIDVFGDLNSRSNWDAVILKEFAISNTISYLTITATKAFIQTGDEVILESLLRKDKFIDFVKGCSHLVSGKFLTDYATKTVWLYPSYDATVHNDEFVEGYFKELDNYDLDKYIIKDSENIDIVDKSKQRYRNIKFKGEGDAAIKRYYNDKDEKDYLAYKVDYGSQYDNDVLTDENPYFAATLFRGYDGLDRDSGIPISMPYMVNDIDNEKPKETYEIVPRILYWAGKILQRVKVEDPSWPDNYAWPVLILLGESTNLLPTAWQDSGDHLFGSGMPKIRTENFAYGERADFKDLFNLFIRKYLYESESNKSISFQVDMPKAYMSRLDHRALYTFTALGRTTIGRMVSISDYSYCNEDARFIIYPKLSALQSCSNITGSGNANQLLCLGNAPILDITKIGNEYVFSYDGTATSPILSIQYAYKLDGTNIWVLATSIDSPTTSFTVRMIVDYEGDCSSLTRTRYVNACGNSPEIIAEYDYLGNCFNVEVGGINISEILYTEIYYGINQNPNTVYSGGCELVPLGTTEIQIEATIHYTDGCESITLTQTLIVPEQTDCDGISADVECDLNANIIRTGDTVNVPALDIIQYRYSENEPWKIWDEVTLIDCNFYYRRVIVYCNGNCPTYCGPSHLCDCIECPESFELQCIDMVISATTNISEDCIVTWTGPNGYTAEGFVAQLDENSEDGIYEATIICSGCTYMASYEFIRPDAGQGMDDQDLIFND